MRSHGTSEEDKQEFQKMMKQLTVHVLGNRGYDGPREGGQNRLGATGVEKIEESDDNGEEEKEMLRKKMNAAEEDKEKMASKLELMEISLEKRKLAIKQIEAELEKVYIAKKEKIIVEEITDEMAGEASNTRNEQILKDKLEEVENERNELHQKMERCQKSGSGVNDAMAMESDRRETEERLMKKISEAELEKRNLTLQLIITEKEKKETCQI